MLRIETILVPVDFSASAEQALQIAVSLGRDHGARLVVMTSPPPQPLPPPGEGFALDSGDIRLVEESRRALDALAKSMTELPVETRLIVGSPGPSIVAAAEDCHADLIVMGTHGRSGLSRVLMGSVAEYVLRHAPCPVLTVKPSTAERLSHVEETASTPRQRS